MDTTAKARINIFLSAGIGAFLLFFSAHAAFAATLYFSPGSGSFTAGQSFTVNVDVSSPDQAMNAAQGVVSFPIDKLEVIALSTRNSAMTLWVEQPSFSNHDGVVNFQGVAVNPGFQGAAGRVLTITFRAKAAGTAALTFTSGSVLANDGQGTNILAAMQPAAFTIAPAAAAPASPVASRQTIDQIPPAPFTISEATDTDPTDPQPIFAWNTTDTGSGINKYLVKVGDGDWFDASAILIPTSTDLYKLPLQAPGNNIVLTVDAYDNAGNMAEASTTFSVAPIAQPVVVTYSKQMFAPTQSFVAAGRAQQGARVKVFLEKTNSVGTLLTFDTQADQNGNWSVSGDIEGGTGTWVMTAQAADTRGALSSLTPGEQVDVGNWFTRTIAFIAGWSGIILAAILLLAFLVVVVYAIEHRLALWRLGFDRELMKMRRELRDDLRRIDKELGDEQVSSSRIDLSPGAMGKRRANIRREIIHIQDDIKKELKRLDDIEKRHKK